MRTLYSAIGITCCSFLLSVTLVSVVSSADDVGQTKPGKTIQGEILAVEGEYVSVKNHATGDVVRLHVDKTTQKRDINLRPLPGENVTTKYDEETKHAITFLTDKGVMR